MSEDPLPDQNQKKRTRSASGDQHELSGDFRGAVINIKSTIVGAAEIKDIENLPPEPGIPRSRGCCTSMKKTLIGSSAGSS
jgi:hypothetical protein